MKEALLYEPVEGGKVVCTACARYCKIGEGQIGLCGIRQNLEGKLQLLVYGKVIAGHVDPIEKKPVTHYMPGSKIFSIATTGCNWLCHPAEAEILLSDGSSRSVKDISPGDAVWSYDLEGGPEPQPGVVTHVGTRTARLWKVHYGRNDSQILLTEEHPVWTKFGWKTVRELEPGDSLLRIWPHATERPTPGPTRELNRDELEGVDPAYVVNHSMEISALLEERRSARSMKNRRDWQGITSVGPIDRVETVYSLETIPHHNYVADGVIVHNCKFCQNYDISQRREIKGTDIMPEGVVDLTLRQGAQGIAYTYNQPTIFIEFAHDIGVLARQAGLINIFVSNGYDTPDTVALMPDFLDAITVDLKGNAEPKFVRQIIGIPDPQPIFDSLIEMRDKTDVHIEITSLVVPQVGDNLEYAEKLSRFVYDELGPDTPIHFLRFHPDYKMMDLPLTPVETLEKHHGVAREVGLNYVYIGNVPGHPLEHTYCPGCGRIAIQRHGFDIRGWGLDDQNRCQECGYQLPIVGDLQPTWQEFRFRPVM